VIIKEIWVALDFPFPYSTLHLLTLFQPPSLGMQETEDQSFLSTIVVLEVHVNLCLKVLEEVINVYEINKAKVKA